MRRFVYNRLLLHKFWSVLFFIFCCFISLAGLVHGEMQKDVKIGVLAKDGAMTCLEMWDSLAYYLSETLGQDIEIRPLDFGEIETVVAAGQVEFLLVNSGIFVDLEATYRLKAIATMLNSRKGIALDRFGGVLFVHKDSPVETLYDIEGKQLLAVESNSFGGYQTQARLLRERGIVPAQVLFAGSHGNVIQRVLLDKGTTLVGAVRTDSLERLAEERIPELRVIHPLVHEDFPFLCSTILYPEWPMAVLAHTDPELTRNVTAALLAMQNDPGELAKEALEYAKIAGWTAAADYGEVNKCLEIIQQPE